MIGHNPKRKSEIELVKLYLSVGWLASSLEIETKAHPFAKNQSKAAVVGRSDICVKVWVFSGPEIRQNAVIKSAKTSLHLINHASSRPGPQGSTHPVFRGTRKAPDLMEALLGRVQIKGLLNSQTWIITHLYVFICLAKVVHKYFIVTWCVLFTPSFLLLALATKKKIRP